MSAFIDPLDFQTILVDYFLGNQVLLFYALTLLISAASGYFQMSNRNYMIILLISSLLFASFVGEALVFVIIFLLGFIGFKIMSRIFAN